MYVGEGDKRHSDAQKAAPLCPLDVQHRKRQGDVRDLSGAEREGSVLVAGATGSRDALSESQDARTLATV